MTRKRGFIERSFADRILQEAHELGTQEVGFYATGEPLINPDICHYISTAKELGFDYTYLTTNGALLSEKVCEELLAAGIDSIKFSINAGTRDSYFRIHGQDDFDRVIKNLMYVSYYRAKNNIKVKLFVSFIVNRLNVTEQDTLKGLLTDYVDEIVFLPVSNQGGMMYENNDFLMLNENSNTRKRPCNLLFNAFTVTYEGYLTACCVDFQNYLVIADLNSTALKDAWGSPLYQELRRKHIENSLEGTLCYNCIYNTNTKIKPISEQYAAIFN